MRSGTQQLEDFDDEGALWGYARRKFSTRAVTTFTLFKTAQATLPPSLKHVLTDAPTIMSIGGGPGNDIYGYVLFEKYSNAISGGEADGSGAGAGGEGCDGGGGGSGGGGIDGGSGGGGDNGGTPAAVSTPAADTGLRGAGGGGGGGGGGGDRIDSDAAAAILPIARPSDVAGGDHVEVPRPSPPPLAATLPTSTPTPLPVPPQASLPTAAAAEGGAANGAPLPILLTLPSETSSGKKPSALPPPPPTATVKSGATLHVLDFAPGWGKMVAKVAEVSGQDIQFHTCNLKSSFDSRDNETLRRLLSLPAPTLAPMTASASAALATPPASATASARMSTSTSAAAPASPQPSPLARPSASASAAASAPTLAAMTSDGDAQKPLVFLFCYVLNEVFGKTMDSRGFDLVAKLMKCAAEADPAGQRPVLCLFREPNEWTEIQLLRRHPEWVDGQDYWKLPTGGLMVCCSHARRHALKKPS